jgi:hypothetical protein
VQAGGVGALGGQVVLQAHDVVLQAQDAQGRAQVVALVEQFPDAAGEGQLAAGAAAVPAPDRAGLTAPAASRVRRKACCTPSAGCRSAGGLDGRAGQTRR